MGRRRNGKSWENVAQRIKRREQGEGKGIEENKIKFRVTVSGKEKKTEWKRHAWKKIESTGK